MIWGQPSQDHLGMVVPCSRRTIPKAHSAAWLLQLELLATKRLSVDSGCCLSRIIFAFSPLCFGQLFAAASHCSLCAHKAAGQKCLVKAFLFPSPMKNDF